ncbi:MAG TPA: ubiquinol-cytochrome c reductase iron-sulfur subunit [Steroidobacteraceae bacterium]|nr:ubiquinol-cytochrome c reductase iron-sulfur subunit [Steroidobacteraceae bacterium]
MTDLTAHGSADFDPVAGEVDDSRRKFLLRATVGMGVVGAAFTATPFVESWLPSERARAQGGPTEVDVSKIDAGQMITTIWRRQPMYIVHRTPAMMAVLGNHDDRLKDATSEDSDQPAYCKNPIRSRNAEYLVLRGICTHLGCLPKQHFAAGDAELGPTWPGGWLCPCHGSRFDMAGRVFDGSPASVNLVIPPYSYPTPTRLIIGQDETSGSAA